MNKITQLAAAAFAGVAAYSPPAAKTTTETGTITEPSAAVASTLTPEQAAQQTNEFTVAVANSDFLVLETSKVAQTMSRNADVKAFARALARDHAAASGELKTWATTSGVTLPTAADDGMKLLIDNIKNADATGFDDKYLDTVIDAYEAVIAKFEVYARDRQDSALRTWATSALPELGAHLEQTNAMRAAVNRT